MHILLIEAELQIPSAQSLKDKRAVLKSIIDRLRTRHNVAVAEIDYQDKWQRSVLAIITVSTLKDRVEQTARAVQQEIETRGDATILAIEEQWL